MASSFTAVDEELPILEGLAFVLFFRGYLREFERLPIGTWGWTAGIAMVVIACALLLRRRLFAVQKGLAAGILCLFLLEIPLSRYGTAAWPLSRKVAGYLTVVLLQLFHFLSLYLATWVPALLPGRVGRWGRSLLFAGLCAYLLCDYEYFRQTGGHVQVTHFGMVLGRDSMRHIGLGEGWWRSPLASLLQLGALVALARTLARKGTHASR